jgi:hypothetical protein
MVERESAIAAAIRALAGTRREERETAAVEIFRVACDEIAPFACAWVRDAEFARLIGAPAPEFTAGVATEPQLFAAIRNANGAPRLADVPPEQDAIEFHLNFGNAAHLEILTTRDAPGEGAIARYLKKFGSGIQHIEIAVSDVDRATEILKTRFSLQPIYPTARPGADGARINFFLIANPAGKKILVELEESARRT